MSKKRISASGGGRRISEDWHSLTDEGYPMPICLELVDDMDSIKGFEADIIKALHSFSRKDLHRKRDPHDLKDRGNESRFFSRSGNNGKRQYSFGKVWSLDVRGRGTKERLIYALDEERNVYKILAFLHDTHR